jgi:hypothetical protein
MSVDLQYLSYTALLTVVDSVCHLPGSSQWLFETGQLPSDPSAPAPLGKNGRPCLPQCRGIFGARPREVYSRARSDHVDPRHEPLVDLIDDGHGMRRRRHCVQRVEYDDGIRYRGGRLAFGTDRHHGADCRVCADCPEHRHRPQNLPATFHGVAAARVPVPRRSMPTPFVPRHA